MKKIITSAALVLWVTFYLPACKKTDKQPTTLEKIQGKWQLDKDVFNDHFSGQDNIDSITGMPGDIIDFRSDGKVYTSIQSQVDTTTYSLSGDTKLVVDGNQNYDITTLTSNSFILHQKVNASGSDFYEETLTLKK
jgi:signal peptidase I